MLIQIEAALSGTKLTVYKLVDGRPEDAPYSQAVLDGCQTFVAEVSEMFRDPEEVKFAIL